LLVLQLQALPAMAAARVSGPPTPVGRTPSFLEVQKAVLRAAVAERDLRAEQSPAWRGEALTSVEAEKQVMQERMDLLLAQNKQLKEEHAQALQSWQVRHHVPPDRDDLIKLLNKPAVFDGKDSGKTEIIDWLLAFKQWLVAVEANPVNFVSTAESYLREEAMRFWLKRKVLMTEEQQQSMGLVFSSYA
jgi:hypothetical protein